MTRVFLRCRHEASERVIATCDRVLDVSTRDNRRKSLPVPFWETLHVTIFPDSQYWTPWITISSSMFSKHLTVFVKFYNVEWLPKSHNSYKLVRYRSIATRILRISISFRVTGRRGFIHLWLPLIMSSAAVTSDIENMKYFKKIK